MSIEVLRMRVCQINGKCFNREIKVPAWGKVYENAYTLEKDRARRERTLQYFATKKYISENPHETPADIKKHGPVITVLIMSRSIDGYSQPLLKKKK